MAICQVCQLNNEEGAKTCYSCGQRLQQRRGTRVLDAIRGAIQVDSTVASVPQEEENWEEAVANSSEAILLDPESAELYFNRGLAYDNLGRHAEAIQDYDKAISLDQTDADAHFHRGLAHADLEQFQAAIQDFGECLRLDPEDPEAYFSRGVIYFRLGQYRAALDDYYQSLGIDPEDSETYAHAALAATLLGLDEEAEEFSNGGVELGFAPVFLGIVMDELKKRR